MTSQKITDNTQSQYFLGGRPGVVVKAITAVNRLLVQFQLIPYLFKIKIWLSPRGTGIIILSSKTSQVGRSESVLNCLFVYPLSTLIISFHLWLIHCEESEVYIWCIFAYLLVVVLKWENVRKIKDTIEKNVTLYHE